LGKQEIACQHSNPVVEAAMDGINPPPGGCLIHHVVMDERGGVNHLGDFSQAPVAGAEVTVRGDGPGDQQDNARPQPLATGGKQVLCGGLKNRVTRANQAAQISQEGVQISLNGL
jgi:hypothetical protein